VGVSQGEGFLFYISLVSIINTFVRSVDIVESNVDDDIVSIDQVGTRGNVCHG